MATAEPTLYSIVVKGRLTERLEASFEGITITPGDTTSVLSGPVRDQSHLMGVLQTIASLGLELISVAPQSRNAACSSPTTKPRIAPTAMTVFSSSRNAGRISSS
jgi:hypothetical protein